MHSIQSRGEKVFSVFNYIILALTALICLLPFIHVLALSLSSNQAIMANRVKLWPVDFTVEPYQYVMGRKLFWQSFVVTLKRLSLGVTLNLLLIILTAYPLSKSALKFRFRTLYVWIFFFTMLFSGGLIPTYLLINNLKLMDTIWSLVLPGGLPIFNMILMLNFFRQIPEEIEDAAYIDGAGHWRILWLIFVPVSTPAIATITLLCLVNHWNSWFDGLIYMNKIENYPLQSYLQTIIMRFDFSKLTPTELKSLAKLNQRSIKAAQIWIACIPILMVYPFLQKYFVKGIVLGSVKG